MSWLSDKDEYDYQDGFSSLENSQLDTTSIDSSNFLNYANLGLSLHSQQSILDFHQLLNNENPNFIKVFEELLYSVVDDVQKYKKDVRRLEKALKGEKDKNEETIKTMIEEAERQLLNMTEKTKLQINAEYEKKIEKMKADQNLEILTLKDNLAKLKDMENKIKESKSDENNRLEELRTNHEKLEFENQELKLKLRETLTEVSILRSENAELKSICNESKSDNYDDHLHEILKLKHEINSLHNANKKLNDTNDILRNELDSFRFKTPELKHSRSNEKSTPNKKLAYNTKTPISLSKFNSSLINSSFDHDEEADSGYIPSGNISDYQYENDFSIISTRTDSEHIENNSEKDIEHNDTDKPTSKELNHLNVNEKLAQTININTKNTSNVPERVFKIVFAGDSGVGKTSFILKFCQGTFNTATSSTLGVDFHIKMIDLDGRKIALQLWDTCGQERFRSIAKSYFRRADGVVLMYDCTSENSFLNIREWIDLINENSDKRIPIILIGNKTDLREETSRKKRCIETIEGAKLARHYQSLFIETSAKDGYNMDNSLIEISRIMSSNQDIELKSDSIRLGLKTASKKNANNCCF